MGLSVGQGDGELGVGFRFIRGSFPPPLYTQALLFASSLTHFTPLRLAQVLDRNGNALAGSPCVLETAMQVRIMVCDMGRGVGSTLHAGETCYSRHTHTNSHYCGHCLTAASLPHHGPRLPPGAAAPLLLRPPPPSNTLSNIHRPPSSRPPTAMTLSSQSPAPPSARRCTATSGVGSCMVGRGPSSVTRVAVLGPLYCHISVPL